ncbi:MAG: transposase, partial [Saprospiraceae bacterium]|nr:transposase [Saprospiraceae bacterium]
MEDFDWENYKKEAVEKLKKGGKLTGKDGVMAPLIKGLLEAALGGELEEQLKEDKKKGRKNRKNGKSRKQLKTEQGSIELETGRDRAGTFEPKIVEKRQTT